MPLRGYLMPHSLFSPQRLPYRFELIRALQGYIKVHETPKATREVLALAHGEQYLEKLFTVGLSRQEAHKLGFAWSEHVLGRSLYSCGGTLAATQDALAFGLGLNLGGGTHHAYPSKAEGYCLFNDVAVAIASLRAKGWRGRILVIDLDVHQGNGTAAFFQHDPTVFTFSMHAANNYPQAKEQSDLDIALADGLCDGEYLEILRPALAQAFAFRPDLVFYNSGVDVLEGDRLGRLNLGLEGLAEREKQVYSKVRESGAALVVVGGGSYNRDPQKIVQGRAQAYRLAVQWLGERSLV